MSTHASPDHAMGATSRRWPLERVLFAMAGTVTVVGALLVAVVSPWWLLLVAFVGVNQLAYVGFGDCPSSLVLRRLFGVERGCPR